MGQPPDTVFVATTVYATLNVGDEGLPILSKRIL